MRWKKISDFYLVSDHGEVKTIERVLPHNKRKMKSIILKHGKTKTGYRFVQINGKNNYIHRLVATAFLENKNNYPQVNHKNGIKYDNRAENLEWCDASYNGKHAYDVLNRCRPNHSGENHPNNKITLIQAMDIIHRYKNKITSAKNLAKEFGLSQNYIYAKPTKAGIIAPNTITKPCMVVS